MNAREGYLPDPDIAVVTRLPDYPLELTLLMPSGQQLLGQFMSVLLAVHSTFLSQGKSWFLHHDLVFGVAAVLVEQRVKSVTEIGGL